MEGKDYFSAHAGIYAAFRPAYPEALYKFLLENVRSTHCAWDCATGNGQVAKALAPHFTTVHATDISQQQLDHAWPAPNILYSRTPAERTAFPSRHFDLVTVAQALHWFDIPSFFQEVMRTGKPGGLLAVWGYSLPTITPEVDAILRKFYTETVSPYWDSARRLVEEEYRNISFPFEPLATPPFSIHLDWSMDHLCGYLSSWSATQLYMRANNIDPVAEVRQLLSQRSGPTDFFSVVFPIFLKVGRIFG